ncbi:MAG: ZIP family metal transporter [Gammaproteobacteria bacterium]
MSLLSFKILAAVIILLITLLGGIWPLLRKTSLQDAHLPTFDFPIGESLAAGIFLGAGLLHMLPDAAQAFYKAGYAYPFPFLIAALGFLSLLSLEHISNSLKGHANTLLSSVALLTATMLSIHSLLEGAAVGIAENLATTLMIFIAILAHKGAASFALATHLTRSRLKLPLIIFSFSFFALMTPLGIFAGSWMVSAPSTHVLLTPIFSALAAGTFLYIGTLHGLDRAILIKHCGNMREFSFMILGFATMAIVAIWT